MRIALAHSSITSRGGGERFVLEAAREWGKRHDVSIYAWDYAPRATFPEFSGLDVNVIGKARRAGPFSKFFSWVSLKPDADVVSAHGFPSHFCSFRHPAVVYYLHIIPGFARGQGLGGLGSRPVSQVDSMAAGRCKAVVANSRFVSSWAGKNYRRSVPVINPGIHPGGFKCRKYGDFALCVARLTPDKRVLELARGWTKAAAGGLGLKIAGTGDPAFVKELRAAVRDNDAVEIISSGIPDSELKRLYSDCRCLVHPAHDEPFGIVLLEAMASGKPVVAHASGGPLEIVTKETGFLARNDGELVEKAALLWSDDGLARKLGRAAKSRAGKFAWKLQLAKLEAVLKQATGA